MSKAELIRCTKEIHRLKELIKLSDLIHANESKAYEDGFKAGRKHERDVINEGREPYDTDEMRTFKFPWEKIK